MPARPPRKQVDDAVQALDTVRRDWLHRDGVTAVDVGFKIKDTTLTEELALRMHVRRKLPLEALPAYEAAIAKKGEKIKGFAVDVIEADYAPAQGAAAPALLLEAAAVDRQARVEPLIGGVSCGNPRITAGTIGAIVFDRETGDPCILSNWHVLAGSSVARPGEPIWQPAPADGGRDADTVATLLRFRLDRDMDAALARLNGRRAHARDLLGLDPISGIEEPVLGMRVTKSGRTTAVTQGLIDGVSMSITLNYGDAGIKTLHDQIHIVPREPWPAVDVEISMGGDSGSVWVNPGTGRAVGLHFAGETSLAPLDEHAVANRIQVVAEQLNFSFTPLFRPVAPPVDEDRLRDLIRTVLCRRFPWLCDSRLPLPPFVPTGPGFQAMPGAGAGEAGWPAEATMALAAGGGIDAVIEEIVQGMRC